MANSSTTWQKGTSGNPNGRPKKGRTLTAILERTGNTKKMYSGDIAPRRLLANLLWQAAVSGEVTFPGDNEATPLDMQDWIGVVKFIYQHIDGPPKNELDVTTNGKDFPNSSVVVILPDNARNDRD